MLCSMKKFADVRSYMMESKKRKDNSRVFSFYNAM